MAQRILGVSGRAGRAGRVKDAGRYKDRLRGNQKFPNKRKKIIYGKELTTPLGRKRINEAQRERYRRALKEKILVKHNIVKTAKKRRPVSAVCLIVLLSCFLLGLIYSHIVLYEKDITIAKWNSEISSEETDARILERELEIKNDLNAFIDYAVEKLGMVKEDTLPKQYLVPAPEDEVVVMEEKR
jgi:cell division protein FtsL